MARTQKRALVQGTISGRNALIYGSILGIIGFMALFFFTNILTVLSGLVGMFFYVVLYGIAKRRSTLGTLVGSIPGAMPPLAGYFAVTNRIDAGAVLLFLILAFWQMPHFYAIGIYRLKDYSEAGLPILPVKKGILTAKIHIILYMIGFLLSALLLSVLHYTGMIYFFIMLILGGYWLFFGIKGFWVKDSTKWARKVFFLSLIQLVTICVLLSVSVFLP